MKMNALNYYLFKTAKIPYIFHLLTEMKIEVNIYQMALLIYKKESIQKLRN